MEPPTKANRCTVVVPSGLEAPRTYRCWHPLPCPAHGWPPGQPTVELHFDLTQPKERVVFVPVEPRRPWLR